MVQLMIPIVTIVEVRETPLFLFDIHKDQGSVKRLFSDQTDFIVRSTITFTGGRLEAGKKTAFVVDVQAPATSLGRSLTCVGSVSTSKSTPEINVANNKTTLEVRIQ